MRRGEGSGRDGESIKKEGIEGGSEGGIADGRGRVYRRKEDDERIGRRGEEDEEWVEGRSGRWIWR